jgi:hypothetical protein
MKLLVLFYSWLSPFLKSVKKGFWDLLKVRPSSLLMYVDAFQVQWLP